MTAFFRRLLPKRIPNTSSQQRDHHANERTFLSWTRAGLGFAAMALALDRLDAIDRVLSSKGNLGAILLSQTLTPAPTQEKPAVQQESASHAASKTQETSPTPVPSTSTTTPQNQSFSSLVPPNAISASSICQVLGLWSLGYGFFRYWSMRRYLLQGQFVPAFWGPVFMTAGSFGAFMLLGLQMDRRRARHS